MEAAVTAATTGQTVTLIADSVVSSTVTINDGRAITLDLNGKTITSSLGNAFKLEKGTLNVVDTAVNKGGISVSGDAFRVYGFGNTAATETVLTIGTGVNVSSETDCCVYILNKATLNTAGNLTSNGVYATIQGNGTATNNGTVINITGGSVTASGGTAIYVPQVNTMTISGGSITADTAVYMKSGNLTISGGSLTGDGIATPYEFWGNGAYPTGDALVIDNCGYPGGVPVVSITGGTFTSTYASAVGSYGSNSYTAVTGFISGGTFNNPVENDLIKAGYQSYAGGTEAAPKYYVYAAGSQAVEYTTATGAVSFLGVLPQSFTNSGTYKLLKDVTSTIYMTPGLFAYNITLDLNGNTLTSTATNWVYNASRAGSAGTHRTLDIIDSSEANDGKIVVGSIPESYCAISIEKNYNDITIGEGVTIQGGGIGLLADNQTLNIYGTINAGDDVAVATNGSDTQNATINVNEGAVLTSNTIAMYLPGTGTTTISGGSTITGSTGIYQKSGTLNVTGGTITGNGTDAEYSHNPSGANSTGDALVIDNCGYPGGAPVVSVTGGTFNSTSENTAAVASYAHTGYTPVTGFITGGTFSSDPTLYLAVGYVTTGTYTVNARTPVTVTATAVNNVATATLQANTPVGEAQDGTELEGAPTAVTVTANDQNNNPIATLAFDAQAVSELVSSIATPIEIKVADNTNNTLGYSAAKRTALTGAAKIIDISATDGNTPLFINSGSQTGTVTVTLNYTREGYTDTDYDKLGVFYVDDQGVKTNMGAQYDKGKQAYVFTTNHFSTYAIMPTSNNTGTYTMVTDFDVDEDANDKKNVATGASVAATVTLTNYVPSATFGSFEVTVDIPTGLTVTAITPATINGIAVAATSVENANADGKITFTYDVTDDYVAIVIGTGVEIADITFTATHIGDSSYAEDNTLEVTAIVTAGPTDDPADEFAPNVSPDTVYVHPDYTVTWDYDDGDPVADEVDENIPYGTLIWNLQPEIPTYILTAATVYIFDGWQNKDDLEVMLEPDDIVTGNVNYKAIYKAFPLVDIEITIGGTVSTSHKYASEGSKVTLTVKPDPGFRLHMLTVTGPDGKAVRLTDNKDGTYSFIMPDGAVTVTATFAAAVNPFTDVKESDFFYDAVLWAVENGVTTGTSTTTFSPIAICTRAQAVTFLWRAAGSPAPKGSSMPFTDVDADAYYFNAVLWAVENNITKGTSVTTFSPDEYCTRAQIVTFLWRADGSVATATSNPFEDVPSDAYYADAVLWAVRNGITTGTSTTTFSPNVDCARAQIVTFLYRYYVK